MCKPKHPRRTSTWFWKQSMGTGNNRRQTLLGAEAHLLAWLDLHCPGFTIRSRNIQPFCALWILPEEKPLNTKRLLCWNCSGLPTQDRYLTLESYELTHILKQFYIFLGLPWSSHKEDSLSWNQWKDTTNKQLFTVLTIGSECKLPLQDVHLNTRRRAQKQEKNSARIWCCRSPALKCTI